LGRKLKIVFTDSGLGGIVVMADFVKRLKQEQISADVIFFNAQLSREMGYKSMPEKEQNRVFNKVLESIHTRYHPDIIAIACNTLSVVYPRTQFSQNNPQKVLSIIDVGKTLIASATDNPIIAVAMPTTIDSKIYNTGDKHFISVASDVQLPDAIENAHTEKIATYLEQIFSQIKVVLQEKNSINIPASLFLGCTHFPIIKAQFLDKAKQKGVKIAQILNPNTQFSKSIIEEINTKHTNFNTEKNTQVAVISRTKFQETEIKNMSNILAQDSEDLAQALRDYTWDIHLF